MTDTTAAQATEHRDYMFLGPRCDEFCPLNSRHARARGVRLPNGTVVNTLTEPQRKRLQSEYKQAMRAAEKEQNERDDDRNPWLPEVGQVAYLATDDFPVEITGVGWINHPGGWVERVCHISYLTSAWGWISSAMGKEGAARRVEYPRGTSSTESAGSLSPEPWPVMQERWKLDMEKHGKYTIGQYPPYQTVAEWEAAPYTLDSLHAQYEPVLPAHMERIEDDPRAAQEAGF